MRFCEWPVSASWNSWYCDIVGGSCVSLGGQWHKDMILRGIGKVPPPAMPVCHGSTVHKLASYPGHTQVQCFKCLRWGHIAQMCHAPPARQHFGCGHVRQKSLLPQSTVLHIIFPLFYPLSSLTFGRPALSLNFGPCLKLGINKGVVPLLLVCLCIFIYISSPFSL